MAYLGPRVGQEPGLHHPHRLDSLPLSTVPHVPVYAERPRRWARKGRLGSAGPPTRRYR